MDTELKRLISAQRCKDESLDFIEESTVDDQGITHIEYKIIDAAGVVYNGVLQPDGTVFDGWMTYVGAKTFERFEGPADTLCGWWSGHWWYKILRDQKGEIFVWKSHEPVSPSEYIMHLSTARALADFIFDLGNPKLLSLTIAAIGRCACQRKFARS
jgi:hypothetical protein